MYVNGSGFRAIEEDTRGKKHSVFEEVKTPLVARLQSPPRWVQGKH